MYIGKGLAQDRGKIVPGTWAFVEVSGLGMGVRWEVCVCMWELECLCQG